MLATGGSASKAIEVLLEKGIREENLIFVNLLASEQGLHVIQKRFPNIHIITAAVDSRLTPSGWVDIASRSLVQTLIEARYIEPGLGDFGDRFYGTLD
jgi:uracil phosphoribosyltransferase